MSPVRIDRTQKPHISRGMGTTARIAVPGAPGPVGPGGSDADVADYINNAGAAQAAVDARAVAATTALYTPVPGNAKHPLTGWYHVSGYGAVGDWNGTTGTDNLPAFNAAVADLVADGGKGVIYIDQPGRYRLSGGWMITGDNVTVICHEAAEVLTTTATGTLGAAVTFMGGGGIQTPSNAVDTPQSTYAAWIGGRISASGSGTSDNALGFVRYKNVYAGGGLRLDADRKALTAQYNVDNVVWERFVVERADVAAVTIETSCNDVLVKDFDVIATLGHGVHVMSVDAVTRRNTNVRIRRGRIRSAGGWGILAGATDGLEVKKLTINAATSGTADYTDCTLVDTDVEISAGATAKASGVGWAKGESVALALLNSWVVQGAGYPLVCAAVRNPFGHVQLSGNVKNGTITAGTTICILPVGYRPPNNRTFAVDSVDNTGAIVAARILVDSAGNVKIQKGGNNFSLSLDHVAFHVV